MYFTTQLPLGEMLFENWKVISKSDLSWTCIVLGLVCFMSEGVKTLKSICETNRPICKANCLKSCLNRWQVAGAGLHFIQCVVAYALMLASMTYNTWVYLSLCVGFGLG